MERDRTEIERRCNVRARERASERERGGMQRGGRAEGAERVQSGCRAGAEEVVQTSRCFFERSWLRHCPSLVNRLLHAAQYSCSSSSSLSSSSSSSSPSSSTSASTPPLAAAATGGARARGRAGDSTAALPPPFLPFLPLLPRPPSSAYSPSRSSSCCPAASSQCPAASSCCLRRSCAGGGVAW